MARSQYKKGIPYSLHEADLVLRTQGHEMDEYHRQLFAYLIGRVRKLQNKKKRLARKDRGA